MKKDQLLEMIVFYKNLDRSSQPKSMYICHDQQHSFSHELEFHQIGAKDTQQGLPEYGKEPNVEHLPEPVQNLKADISYEKQCLSSDT